MRRSWLKSGASSYSLTPQEPSEGISPAVAEFLKQQGMDASSTPKKVTRADIVSGSQIISLGCDLDDLPLQGEAIERWDDVPPVSQNLEKSWSAIRSKVDALINQLKPEF
jgi:protein-tyrosine-phosphatase